MSHSNETFIASNVTSLEDFIKSSVSYEKSIHCTFPYECIVLDYYIKKKLIEMEIKFVSFSDGKCLIPPY